MGGVSCLFTLSLLTYTVHWCDWLRQNVTWVGTCCDWLQQLCLMNILFLNMFNLAVKLLKTF